MKLVWSGQVQKALVARFVYQKCFELWAFPLPPPQYKCEPSDLLVCTVHVINMKQSQFCCCIDIHSACVHACTCMSSHYTCCHCTCVQGRPGRSLKTFLSPSPRSCWHRPLMGVGLSVLPMPWCLTLLSGQLWVTAEGECVCMCVCVRTCVYVK